MRRIRILFLDDNWLLCPCFQFVSASNWSVTSLLIKDRAVIGGSVVLVVSEDHSSPNLKKGFAELDDHWFFSSTQNTDPSVSILIRMYFPKCFSCALHVDTRPLRTRIYMDYLTLPVPEWPWVASRETQVLSTSDLSPLSSFILSSFLPSFSSTLLSTFLFLSLVFLCFSLISLLKIPHPWNSYRQTPITNFLPSVVKENTFSPLYNLCIRMFTRDTLLTLIQYCINVRLFSGEKSRFYLLYTQGVRKENQFWPK